jgi:hypothetical protein
VILFGGNIFYDYKNKIPIKILAGKRFGIGIIAEFSGIPREFPNQAVAQHTTNLLLELSMTFLMIF